LFSGSLGGKFEKLWNLWSWHQEKTFFDFWAREKSRQIYLNIRPVSKPREISRWEG
jgi:hypothetical protein